MTLTKDKHYWTQLRAALTAGLWDSSFPGKAPNGSPLSWSELLRKFKKHCSGFKDYAEVASQTQALALLLSADGRSLDGNRMSPSGPFALGDECLLPEERIEDGIVGYNALKGLTASNTDSIQLAVAHYAYALGRPSECLSILAAVKDLSDVQGRIPMTESPQPTLSRLQVPSGGPDSSVSSWTGSFASGTSEPAPDIIDGRAWAITECIRSICLQGMSHERISPTDPQEALDVYLTASPLLSAIVADISPSIPTKPGAAGAPDVGSFVRYRELWRWVERLLRRAILLAAQASKGHGQAELGALWTLLAHHQSCSAHWPPDFRPQQRSTIAALHLRALVLRAQALPADSLKLMQSRWLSTARALLQEYRAILAVSTRFPRAGERNVKVEDFVDLCVAVWEADKAAAESAGWAIDMLWWATRLTFNSFRIYRHMTRLLCVSGDTELAKRTLRLYVQVVSKAQETGVSESESVGSGVEMETDHHWVQTLVHGARMLCRLALQESDYGKAVEEAREAGVMIEKAKTRLDAEDKELLASVQRAEGIWHLTMAHAEQDPRTRTTRISQSIDLLRASTITHPTASTYHHLALALSRPGPSHNLLDAIKHARSAIEADPGEVRHWHLLGLLLAASGDWRAAKEVLDFGIGVSEEGLAEESDAPSTVEIDGVSTRDFAAPAAKPAAIAINGDAGIASADPNVQVLVFLLPDDPEDVPPAATLLQSLGDRPPVSRQDRFEHALQVRMTQLALTELVKGPEGVGEDWLEVFQWFREKRGVSMDDRRSSIDSRRVSSEVRAPSEVIPPLKSIRVTDGQMTSSSYLTATNQPAEDLPTPIPITITPASPGMHTPPEYSHDRVAATAEQLLDDNATIKRPSLDEKGTDVSRGKKVREVLKNPVRKGRAAVSTVSRKIGHGVHGVGRHTSAHLHLKRATSAPDFHSLLNQTPYQASSIHSRQHQSIYVSQQDLSHLDVPPPPSPTPTQDPTPQKLNSRNAKDRRLLSDLWLMSAATFRRLGKIEQARGAIQEAEVRDEENPAIWVQLGLYYMALDDQRQAIQSFQKALFLSPSDISATIHLCRIYLSADSITDMKATHASSENVDLAAGLLSDLTQGTGWDVPEAWYFLGRAYELQGRRDRERECLCFALTLSESRGVRDIGCSVGWCL